MSQLQDKVVLANKGQNSKVVDALSPERDQFVRREEKFFLPIELRDQFIALIKEYLPPFYPDTSTEYTYIESVYYDNDDLKSLVDHFNREEYRFKLRTRRYAPNGVWAGDGKGETFIELKTKQHEISDKLRLKLRKNDLMQLQAGNVLDLPVKKLRTVLKINNAIELVRPRPVCRVTYRRFAFQEGQLRVTIDDQLNGQLISDCSDKQKIKNYPWWAHAIDMANSFDTSKISLVEVKHLGSIPEWLYEFMNEHQLQFRGFSKYCYTMASNILTNSLEPKL